MVLFFKKLIAAIGFLVATHLAFTIPIDQQLCEKVYKDYLFENIPEIFVEDFFTATHEDVQTGLELLAIGFKESKWQENAVGTNYRNKQIVSYDYGPLQLNSANIEYFSKIYHIEIPEIPNDNFYMKLCISHYKSLKTRYSKYQAWIAYNGGESQLRSNNIKNVCKSYADNVLVILKDIEKAYKKFFRLSYGKLEYANYKYCRVLITFKTKVNIDKNRCKKQVAKVFKTPYFTFKDENFEISNDGSTEYSDKAVDEVLLRNRIFQFHS